MIVIGDDFVLTECGWRNNVDGVITYDDSENTGETSLVIV